MNTFISPKYKPTVPEAYVVDNPDNNTWSKNISGLPSTAISVLLIVYDETVSIPSIRRIVFPDVDVELLIITFLRMCCPPAPFIQFGSTLGSIGGSPIILKNLTFIGNGTSSDGIVTVNLINYWENVATMSFGSVNGVRIIGAGGQHTLRNVIINNSTSTSGNAILRIDGIDTISSYTINGIDIDVLGRPDIFLDHVLLSGLSTSYASGTVGLYLADINALTSTYCYIGLVNTLISDTNAYAAHNVFFQIYAEFFSQSVKGATSTPTAIGNQFVIGSTSSTSTDIIKLRVPAVWYYSFTGSGVTFATATPFAE